MPNLRQAMMAAAGASTDYDGGKLFTWGKNNHGQLGQGNTTEQCSPVQVGSDTDWWKVSVGQFHTIALRGDGTLWSWGHGGSEVAVGGLGDGTWVNRSSPAQVGSKTNWRQIEASTNKNCCMAIDDDGKLYSWGFNTAGQGMLGNTTVYASPAQVGALTTWTACDTDGDGSIALQTGKIFTCGEGSSGQLGGGSTTDLSSPVQVGALTTWESVAFGGQNAGAIKNDGVNWGWGEGGRVGNDDDQAVSSPVLVAGGKSDWAQITRGQHGAHSIDDSNRLWAWGRNMAGINGNGATLEAIQSGPVQVGSLTDWAFASRGYYSAFFVKTDGTLWATGSNHNGQRGTGDTPGNHDSPIENSPVQIGSDTAWLYDYKERISAGKYHTAAIRS